MKKFIISLWLSFSGAVLAAQPFLVTLEEMQESNSAPLQISSRSSPVKDAPLIEIVSPKLLDSVGSPARIELTFQSTAPSNVKPDSFRALYGTFQIDITKRLLSLAKVTDTGVLVQEASLPKGRHKILLVIEDSAGRIGSRLFDFAVN
jgi:hypothetical protein